MRYRLLYFASLADRAGCAYETLDTRADSLPALYEEVSRKHGFQMAAERIRIAVNGSIVDWNHVLRDGDEVVFLPPVSGG
jgi:molybdopterin synthase sulfur carrier subunit